eukprot:5398276-Prymnesium_polylepis.2
MAGGSSDCPSQTTPRTAEGSCQKKATLWHGQKFGRVDASDKLKSDRIGTMDTRKQSVLNGSAVKCANVTRGPNGSRFKNCALMLSPNTKVAFKAES